MVQRLTNLCPPGRRRGFTFTEVMFAVIILGIGFIMLAGIFPVAIQQTEVTIQETAASSVGPAAAKYIAQIPVVQEYRGQLFTNLRPTNGRFDLVPWHLVQRSMIVPEDPRFAWVAFYRRDANWNYIQVIVLCAQARNYQFFSMRDVLPIGNGSQPATLAPAFVEVTAIQPDPYLPTRYLARIEDPEQRVADGAYLIHRESGRIFRIGNSVPGQNNLWQLMPGNGVELMPNGQPAQMEKDAIDGILKTPAFWVLGRGYADPAVGGPRTGLVMDIGVYSTFVMVK